MKEVGETKMKICKHTNPLVSILSPCWNGEQYIARMLESILMQTYSNIELFCIDDGSTDHTKDVILSFIDKFKEKGKELTYIYQENQGQAAAINKGLQFIKGEFLSWIDCDDFLTKDSVEKKAKVLIENKEYSVVTSNFYYVDENDLENIIDQRGKHLGYLCFQKNQFQLALAGYSIIESHAQMIRVSDMRKINPEMTISLCKEGQNYQLLLPMYYFYRRAYINEPLAYYVLRKNSHYHRERTYSEQLARFDLLQRMLRETFSKMKLTETEIEKYIRISTFYKEERSVIEKHGRNKTLVR